LNTCITLTPISCSAVTGVPLGRVNALEVPFNVRVTGKVVVVPVGNESDINTVKYPTGYILRNPRAISTLSVLTVILVELIYGIPPALVVTFIPQPFIIYPPISIN
jgi:hypothetical protein